LRKLAARFLDNHHRKGAVLRSQNVSYRVRPGDCLSTIAQRHNLSLAEVVRANPQLRNPNLIFAGQELHIPGRTDTFEPAVRQPAASPAPAPTAHTAPIGDLPRSSSSFINAIARGAVEGQQRYGVPASVTIAQAILESGWGRSTLAAQDHNLFGVKGSGPAGSALHRTREYVHGRYVTVRAAFRRYHNAAESMLDHARLLATHSAYRAAMSVRDDARAFAHRLQGVYATSPTYAKSLIDIMNDYNLYAYDRA
jgi:flagellum-specific peptidoglycan hydrolase FlgJ